MPDQNSDRRVRSHWPWLSLICLFSTASGLLSQDQRPTTHFTFEKRGKPISRPAGMPKPGPYYTTLVKMDEIADFPYDYALYFSTDRPAPLTKKNWTGRRRSLSAIRGT